jgi:trehalose synthase-fused probable maltokinase
MMDRPAAVAVWTGEPPARKPLHLFVPLALVPAEDADVDQVIAAPEFDMPFRGRHLVVEAFSLDAFVRGWISAILDGEIRPANQLRTGSTVHLDHAAIDVDKDWSIRRCSTEQSNTSIRIGEGAILKVIRKLEEGPHPELEVGRFLSEAGRFEGIPALLGWTELEHAIGGCRATLSVLQAYVPNQGDGWAWVLERLGRAAESGNERCLDEVMSWVRRLGVRTAQMHRTLAAPTDDPAFRPEPAERDDFHRWSEAAQGMARRALQGLAETHDRLDLQARHLAGAVLARIDLLTERLNALRIGDPAFAKTRHHGDYHLGQVLVADDDAIIVDFEGEPMRPLSERRAKHAPLRDVAGMLRSFAYAAAAAHRSLVARPTIAVCEAAQDRLATWESVASRIFLDTYLDAARGSSGVPAERVEAERVVRFFMLEKALYEVVYELANRPDWVAIPLRGVLALLDDNSATTRMPYGAELQRDGSAIAPDDFESSSMKAPSC